MKPIVTRGQIISRGLSHCCPNCGEKTLFTDGNYFRMNRECPKCHLVLEREEGSFLGAVSLNYGITIVCFLVPILLLYLAHVISGLVASLLAGIGAVGFPVLFYRTSRSLWLMNYYLVLPHHLPSNQRLLSEDEDANT